MSATPLGVARVEGLTSFELRTRTKIARRLTCVADAEPAGDSGYR
jgi:hypothetical protein